MRLYNMVNGMNQAAFFILPMLGKQPDEYPRFRDCWAGKLKNNESKLDQFGLPLKRQHNSDDSFITVYTRTGGRNRDESNTVITTMPEYVEDYDDAFDSTFAFWIFKVPERWKADYQKIVAGDIKEISQEYQEEMKRVFPSLSDKFEELFVTF